MRPWEPLVARARGLSGHLLPRATLHSLAASADRRALVDGLVHIGYLAFPPNQPPPDDRAVERAVRRVAARRLAILERWSRECGDALVPVLEDEDRRSVRALVRGALGSVAAEVRTFALIPTSTLPARALDELSLLNDAGAIGAALLAMRHPFGAVVAAEARRERPDLFALDQAVLRAWAVRALGAVGDGDAAMRTYVERTIDLQNLWTARLIAEQRAEVDVDAVFVEGGSVVTRDDIVLAHTNHNVEQLAAELRSRLGGTPLGAALRADARSPDGAALAAFVAEFRTLALREPLGLAPVVLYILRLREEHRVLMRLLWQLALGVPAAVRIRDVEEAA